jgi:succinyl-diaminopimelate desuccinylase
VQVDVAAACPGSDPAATMNDMTDAARHDDPLALLHALVAIPSVNRSLAPTATGESAIADFCRRWLEERGFVVRWLEEHNGSPTLVAYCVGSGDGKTLVLNGHLDTVGVDTFEGNPFKVTVEEDRLYGRGTYDMKGSIAAALVAAARAIQKPLAGTLILALVSDEEFGSIGTEEALQFLGNDPTLHVDGAVVMEPSSLELTIAHRGFAWFDLELVGRAAHGSQPELGVDAIAGATVVLSAVEQWSEQLAAGPAHPLLGTGTVRVSTIVGGVDAATIAPSCRITIERRTNPGEHPDAVEDELRFVVKRAVESVPGLRHQLTRMVGRPAFEADPDTAVVHAIAAATQTHRNLPPATRAEPFWTDAALFAEAGIPCVVFGVDGGGAHADREWVSAKSVTDLTSILEMTIRDFCG